MKLKNERSVAILMATYNGSRYISEQIESILNQTFTDWSLYIQDDGSTDNTREVIKQYVEKDNRIVIVDTGLTRQGAGLNFMNLLNMVESEYYMFSDQDDVWFVDKIEKTYLRMKEEEKLHPDKPVLVHTDRRHTDALLNVTLESEFNQNGLSYEKVKRKIDSLKNPNILKIYTIAGGCTMMLNHLAKKLSFPFIGLRVHDSICAMAVVNNHGVISSILEPTMYYRIHGNNTCGVSSTSIKDKLLNIFSTISSNMKGFYIWKVYGGGSFFKFLYWRIRYFLILRLN